MENILKIRGVRMLIKQGNLDHWFDADLWGDGSSVRPSGGAFDLATEYGLLERHHTGTKWRLTNLGRHYRNNPAEMGNPA